MEDGADLLTKTQKQGYLKVEILGITCSKVDKRVVNRLKYKKAYSTFPAQWFGYSNETHIFLTNAWVVKNFPKAYVKQVKIYSGRTASYVKIPPGNRKTHARQDDTTSPTVRYQQKDNERTCMMFSMASIMYYSGIPPLEHG